MDELDPKMRNVIIGYFIVFFITLALANTCELSPNHIEIYEYEEEPIDTTIIMRS